MLRMICLLVLVGMGVFAPVVHAKTPEQKIHEIAWVVFCEDNTTPKASKMVLSTIYNRAKSHDIHKLHKEIARPKQYYCHRIKPTAKKLQSRSFAQIKQMVRNFVHYQKPPITKALYFYNHKQVKRSALGTMKLRVAEVYGSHTYLY